MTSYLNTHYLSKLLCVPTIITVLTAAGCSTQSQLSSAPAGASLTVSSHDLYTQFAKVPQAQVDATFTTLKAMSIAQYYDMQTQFAVNTPVVLDGKTLSNGLAKLTANRAQILALGSLYPTMGDYWKSLGITSGRMSEATFTSGVQKMLGTAASTSKSLSLYTADYQAVDSDDCTDKINNVLKTSYVVDDPASADPSTIQAGIGEVITAMNQAATDGVNKLESIPDAGGVSTNAKFGPAIPPNGKHYPGAPQSAKVTAFVGRNGSTPLVTSWDLGTYDSIHNSETGDWNGMTDHYKQGKYLGECFQDQQQQQQQ